MIPLWILGGGGHALSVIDAARSSGRYDVRGVLDDKKQPGRDLVSDVPVVGSMTPEVVESLGVTNAVIAIGDNRLRKHIAHRMDGLVTWASVVHAQAYVASQTQVGAGTVICAKAVVQPGTTIGDHAILNTACSVDHESTVGNVVHIAPGCHVAAVVTVDEGVFVGIGSSVIAGRRIGAWTVVGAGAAVISDLPPNVTAVGVPAKVITKREAGWHLV